MSFAMTTAQVRARTKTVTRRFGWWFLRPGDELWAVEKVRGLKKGDKIQRIAMIMVINARPEKLNAITRHECVKEGFVEMPPEYFVKMLVEKYKCKADDIINRIEFQYI